jgi:hypothetical protein
MLTGEGFIAKTILAIVTKAGEKLLGIPFDKKKKACRVLTKLYYSTVSLDEATDRFLEEFDHFPIPGKANALITIFGWNAHKVSEASSLFLELSHELHAGLKIIDPGLADFCGHLAAGKGSLLGLLSNCSEVSQRDGQPVLNIYRPNERILGTDFEASLKWCEELQAAGVSFYWPQGVFEFFQDFEEISITTQDDALALELIELIKNQNALLKQARESLRTVLVANFSIEDILFQPKSRP